MQCEIDTGACVSVISEITAEDILVSLDRHLQLLTPIRVFYLLHIIWNFIANFIGTFIPLFLERLYEQFSDADPGLRLVSLLYIRFTLEDVIRLYDKLPRGSKTLFALVIGV